MIVTKGAFKLQRLHAIRITNKNIMIIQLEMETKETKSQ